MTGAAVETPRLQSREDAMAERTERDVLHHLIDRCRDGERGFRAAADHVGDPALKSLFTELAAQRKRFAEELLPHLQRLGGMPDAEGTGAGALHRTWMVLKGLVPGDHDHHILAEAQRGEHAAWRAYEDALDGMLPPTVSEIVEAQRDAIRKATDRIHAIDVASTIAD
ncbi:MAG: PA2169 family four-helix-bundle protein [Acidobacteria bacterium]|nr:PA2169 family four-helix-bundle protein [Acidobacteriota bacterium]